MKIPHWPRPPVIIETLGTLVAIEQKCDVFVCGGNPPYYDDCTKTLPPVTTFAIEFAPHGIGLEKTRLYLTLDYKSYTNLRWHFLREINRIVSAASPEDWK